MSVISYQASPSSHNIHLRLSFFFLFSLCSFFFFFFFNDTATTEIYTLSLHDALPIYHRQPGHPRDHRLRQPARRRVPQHVVDRKSTRLNSSHLVISYAVFCLKKKKIKHILISTNNAHVYI